jgi:hypothetical protein
MLNVNIQFQVRSEDELQRICLALEQKIRVQANRSPEVTCTHPEDEDRIRNVNGSIVGEIDVKITDDHSSEVLCY